MQRALERWVTYLIGMTQECYLEFGRSFLLYINNLAKPEAELERKKLCLVSIHLNYKRIRMSTILR